MLQRIFFSVFSTKRATVASAAKLTVLFCDNFFVRHVSGIWYSQSLQSVYYGSQAVKYSFRHSPQITIVASRDKNRAMWRTTGVLAVKNRFRYYRPFRRNYDTVLQYWFLAQPTREKQSGDLQRYNSSCHLGVLKRTSDHRRYYHPQSNTRRERRPSPNKYLLRMHEFSETAFPERTSLTSRAGKATRGLRNAYILI